MHGWFGGLCVTESGVGENPPAPSSPLPWGIDLQSYSVKSEVLGY